MRPILPILALVGFLTGCTAATPGRTTELKAHAERFFRGVYGCGPAAVDELAGEGIVLSYPIFAELYNTSAFRGRPAVREFAERFCRRWKDARFTFHERVADGPNVVLVWSFSARFVGNGTPGGPAPGAEQAWGGISLFQFDSAGKIVAEIGEESVPGPMARLSAGGAAAGDVARP